ncbi:hypothetical protein [Geminicoccus roseus]|uniref:hypothetical protein n=1 Tax=Geminicoccus roseus TaxID=404900 RepID=UPI0012F859A7|nr:hypothetical protein [Geminicoccus roseus]
MTGRLATSKSPREQITGVDYRHEEGEACKAEEARLCRFRSWTSRIGWATRP